MRMVRLNLTKVFQVIGGPTMLRRGSRAAKSCTKFGAVVLALSVITACGGSGGASGGSQTLTFGHPFPDTFPAVADVMVPFADELNEATGGDITLEIVGGGALGGGDVVYENVVSGAQDLGMAVNGYTPGRFPLTEVIELPFLFTSGEAATNTYWDLWEEFPELQAQYDDVKVLAVFFAEVGDIYTTSKQVTDASDIDGLRIRTSGTIQQKLIEQLGGDAVNMVAADVPDSLQRDVLDGLLLSRSGITTLSLHDTVKYRLECNCYVLPEFVVMNMDVWNSLSQEQQDEIDELTGNGRDLSVRIAKALDEAGDESVQLGEESGDVVSTLSDSQMAEFQEAGDVVIADWVKEREDQGLPAQEIYDAMLAIIESGTYS